MCLWCFVCRMQQLFCRINTIRFLTLRGQTGFTSLIYRTFRGKKKQQLLLAVPFNPLLMKPNVVVYLLVGRYERFCPSPDNGAAPYNSSYSVICTILCSAVLYILCCTLVCTCLVLKILLTELRGRGRVGNSLASQSKEPGLSSRPNTGYPNTSFRGFLCSSSQILGQHLKLDYSHFLLHHSQFMIHRSSSIRLCTGSNCGTF